MWYLSNTARLHTGTRASADLCEQRFPDPVHSLVNLPPFDIKRFIKLPLGIHINLMYISKLKTLIFLTNVCCKSQKVNNTFKEHLLLTNLDASPPTHTPPLTYKCESTLHRSAAGAGVGKAIESRSVSRAAVYLQLLLHSQMLRAHPPPHIIPAAPSAPPLPSPALSFQGISNHCCNQGLAK